MEKKLLIILLLLSTLCSAQKSVQGRLVIDKSDDKGFILRNTKVMLVTGTKTDSTAIAEDLTFVFNNVESNSAEIYLKSPILSPKAVTKFRLRKNKPTEIKLHYQAIYDYSVDSGYTVRERGEFPIAEAASLFQMIFLLFTAFHK